MTLDRVLLVLTPLVATAAVALGLRLGAPGETRAAVVYAAPPAHDRATLAWQVVVFREDNGAREPLEHLDLEVVAQGRERTERWHGTTNDDGIAEAILPLSGPSGSGPLRLEVRTGDAVLAAGEVGASGTPTTPIDPGPPTGTWMPFVRREGPIQLDAVVLGTRASPGFPSTFYVRATDPATHAPVAGASVELEKEASIALGSPIARTDSRGWAEFAATPVGFAVMLTLHAHTADGRAGEWIGSLTMAPGAAQVETRRRWAPDEDPEVDLVDPTMRKSAYVEVDDSTGRAWAATVALAAFADGTSRVGVRVPRLAPGLYWAIASTAPFGLAEAETRTTRRPFFVAPTDAAALAFGTDPGVCLPPADVRESSRALSACLALSAALPIERWVALDGFSSKSARDHTRRASGLRIALGAILVAVLLEVALLLRAAAASRARFPLEGDDDAARSVSPARWWGVVVAVLVALLGFALLAAFVVRLA